MVSQRAIDPATTATTEQASSPDGQAIRLTLSLRIASSLAGESSFEAGFSNCQSGYISGNKTTSIDNLKSFK